MTQSTETYRFYDHRVGN